MTTLILFDVDGTLVDSQAHIMAAMDRTFAAVGQPSPSRAQVLSIVGLSLDMAFFKLWPQGDAALRQQMVEDYKQAFHDLRSELTTSPLYPGALECIRHLAAKPGLALGIATGKSRRGLDHVLDSHDLRGVFETQQVADDHPSKPHPSMCHQAMADTNAVVGVMIGDTTFDLEMGRNAGLSTLGVSWGYHPVEQLAPLADAIADSFAQVPNLLNEMDSAR